MRKWSHLVAKSKVGIAEACEAHPHVAAVATSSWGDNGLGTVWLWQLVRRGIIGDGDVLHGMQVESSGIRKKYEKFVMTLLTAFYYPSQVLYGKESVMSSSKITEHQNGVEQNLILKLPASVVLKKHFFPLTKLEHKIFSMLNFWFIGRGFFWFVLSVNVKLSAARADDSCTYICLIQDHFFLAAASPLF